MWLSERNCVFSVLCLTLIISSTKLSLSDSSIPSLERSGANSQRREAKIKTVLGTSDEAETLDLAGLVDESEYDKSNSDLSGRRDNPEEYIMDQDGAEWIVKLFPTPTATEWSLHNILSMESDEEKADRLAVELGLVNLGRVDPFPSVFRFQHDPSIHRMSGDRDVREKRIDREQVDLLLAEHPSLLWASREKALVREKRTDYLQLNDPMFAKQWHLLNSMEPGHDINITRVWQSNITGMGVVVAVVDDGLEHSNADIQQNYNAAGSYDFNDNDPDPSPNLESKGDNTHGTKCAGLIAAVPNNGICAVGVALGAEVSGIRMLDGKVTDSLEAQSFIYKAHLNWIYSCSWGPEDNGRTIEGPGKLAQSALELGAAQGRYGYGNIYVFASGNGGQLKDNCNFDGYANSIYTLTVGAIDEKNKMPYYAELCPSMLAVTYSNGHMAGDRTIVTTDASSHGGCTKSFSGTSAAAPIAAGMVALMLQIRNCLSWRDVQSILVYSAVKIDIEGAEWVENAAGFHHSNQHGFGLMDAYRVISVSKVWPLLPKLLTLQVSRSGHGTFTIRSDGAPLLINITAVREKNGGGDGVNVASVNSLEYVAMTITLHHVRRGALEISLTSPNRTYCTLSTPRPNDKSTDGLSDWTFTSTRFWGETPEGVWTLKIVDNLKLFQHSVHKGGVLKDWKLTLYGSELSPEDVQRRRSVVAEAILSSSPSPALSCPDLPPVPDDLSLPLGARSLKLWERIVVFVLAVVGGVLILHLLFELFCNRYRMCKRKRQLSISPSNNVHFANGSKSVSAMWLDDENDESISDMEETSTLIQSARERTSVPGNNEWKSPVTMETGIGVGGGSMGVVEEVCSSTFIQSARDRASVPGNNEWTSVVAMETGIGVASDSMGVVEEVCAEHFVSVALCEGTEEDGGGSGGVVNSDVLVSGDAVTGGEWSGGGGGDGE